MNSEQKQSRKQTALLPTMMAMALIVSCNSGCASKVLVIPSDRVIVPLEVGQTLAVTNRGFFVPDATMQDMLHRMVK
jgi:hypothetical protein